ncbi:hypothetical protein M422DRAFT_77320, partial [Sphaerobolus stellatus SS14]
AANRLSNGGIVYELDSSEAAKLIQDNEEVRKRFTDLYSAQASIKPRLYPIIAERVPTSFKPDSNADIRNLEESNGIYTGEIERARWIKPPERRDVNQRAAHLIILVSNPRTANRLIRDGIRIHQTLLWCRKLLKEPSRCLKCHRIGTGHFASQCTESEEKCGTCGSNHRTKNCPVSDRDSRYCVNCKTRGHAAWDHGCPTFVAQYNKFAARVPDNQYKYYP